jgi:hypothetical protein
MAKLQFTLLLGLSLTESDKTALGMDLRCLETIQDTLASYFGRILAQPGLSGNAGLTVAWGTAGVNTAVTDRDLVVYFVRDPKKSVIQSLNLSVPSGEIGGATNFDSASLGTVSEVYVENNFPPKKLANMAFHELMHNKLQKNDSLHDIKGVGMGVSPATECSVLTDTDVRLMAARMTTAVKQYTGKLTNNVSAPLYLQAKASVARFMCTP